jgi:hypothetical protein
MSSSSKIYGIGKAFHHTIKQCMICSDQPILMRTLMQWTCKYYLWWLDANFWVQIMYYSLRSKLFVVYLSKYACAREYIKCGYRPGMSYFRSPVIVHFINGPRFLYIWSFPYFCQSAYTEITIKVLDTIFLTSCIYRRRDYYFSFSPSLKELVHMLTTTEPVIAHIFYGSINKKPIKSINGSQF